MRRQIRWYLDEDAMARALVRGLEARGIAVSTPIDAGLRGEADNIQLEYASAQGLTIFTFNVGDFCRLHASYLEQERGHSGIVVVPRQRLSLGQQIRALSKLTSETRQEDIRQRLVFLEPGA